MSVMRKLFHLNKLGFTTAKIEILPLFDKKFIVDPNICVFTRYVKKKIVIKRNDQKQIFMSGNIIICHS